MSDWRSRGAALLLAALTLAGGGPPARAVAPPTGVADTVTVTADQAWTDYPNGVDFSFTAASTDEIERVELFYRPALDETMTMEVPVIEPGRDVSLTHEVDLRDGTLPPGQDLIYLWRVVEADGDVAETPERRVLWSDTRFDWQAVLPATGKVSVYAYNGDAAFNAEVLAAAEATVDELSTRFGAEIEDPIRVWVYNSGEDLSGALAPNSEPWIAGAAYPWYGLILAVLPPGDRDELARVIPHEISHQVLYQATLNPFNVPPSWLDEGLATSVQETGRADLWRRVADAAAEGRLDRLRSLNGQFPYDASDAVLAYAESMSVVQYVIDTYGEEGLSRLIAVFREGVSYEDAVQRALGVSLDELDAAWRAQAGAQAEQQLAALGVGGDGSGMSDTQAFLLASGSLVMGLVALLAVVFGARAALRTRRLEPDPEPPGGAWGAW